MGKFTYIGGKLIESVGGDYRIISDSIIEFKCNKYEAKGVEKGISFNDLETIDYDNAFIPIVDILENKEEYEIIVKEETIKLDIKLDLAKRDQQQKVIKINKSKKDKIKLTFSVKKGNSKANDSDGGYITAEFYDIKTKLIDSKEVEVSNYDN